ncbi:amino acid ABC transporter ATP-binding protein [Vibrio salinus]|uniref:amino acid ABC transporter ATP-binding protein n=1 Tax=Vibrio salinus TaxID=2899784 RepID=UPI001E3E3AAD|nr:amino acid ABC transporter ATP-binding protein [Vibrio salinus]MCE0494727.1 amino acid ABC transporter ATP-binding protein [Vibrio salinus]
MKNELQVSVQGLAKSFDDLEVLRKVDFNVKSGEVVTILGPSGSGKTTLLRSLNFLEEPDTGIINICGNRIEKTADTPLTKQDRAAIRQLRLKTGMVFQSFNLFPHLTVLENIIEGPVTIKKVAKQTAIQKASDLLRQVGLEDKAGLYPSKLSGGQKQRVAIARSLAMEPELILFDEPTSALDPELKEEVLSVMRNLAKSGITMIIVTHEIRFARDVADRIIFMENGIVVADENPERFFHHENPRISEFLGSVDLS